MGSSSTTALTPMMFVVDLKRMTRFYSEGFDLTADVTTPSTTYQVLRGDRAALALHTVPDHVAAKITITSPAEPRSDAAIKLVFTVDDISARAARLTRLGAQMFETTTDDAMDGIDPEGNVFRLGLR